MESPSSTDDQPPNTIDAEETYQHRFLYFTLALRSLATLEPVTQCDANGNRIVGHELQSEAPIRVQAISLLTRLVRRISENNGYFKHS